MRKFLIFGIFVIGICFLVFISAKQNQAVSKSVPAQIQKAGCCSRHGGVCGCSSGRAKCCDGTLSPSCGCN